MDFKEKIYYIVVFMFVLTFLYLLIFQSQAINKWIAGIITAISILILKQLKKGGKNKLNAEYH